MDFLSQLTITLTLTFYLALFNYIIFRPGSAIYRFFYNQVKHNLNKTRGFYLIHGFHIFLYLCYLLRFLYIIFKMSKQGDQEILLTKYNFFFNFLRAMSTGKDYFYVLIFIMFFIFVLLIEPNLYFSRIDTITWLKYDDLVVKELRHLPALSDQGGQQDLLHSSTPAEFNFDRTLFAQSRLPHFATLSVDNRVKFIRALHILDKACAGQVVLFDIFCTVFIAYYYLEHCSSYPLWFQPVLCLDLFLFAYILMRMILLGSTLLLCSNTCSFLYISHITEANEALSKLYDQLFHNRGDFFLSKSLSSSPRNSRSPTLSRRSPSPSKSPTNFGSSSSKLLTTLHYFLVEHTKMAVVVRTVGSELWSRVLLICLAVHVPSNVYLLYRLLQAKSFIGSSQITLSLTFLLLQVVILSASILPLAQSSTVFHRSSKLLAGIQLAIEPAHLRYKLKTGELYERLNSEDRYGLTVGSTGTITYPYLFQIVLLYIAFIFKLFDSLS
ncbi:hypothetical protein TYRP_021186 [Tyrophagus putrescentiae]|nr:hypothetical protein TYRP_021186 [Tyrophagus putrescentiae]